MEDGVKVSKKRKKVYYQIGTFHGKPSGCLSFELSHLLRKNTNELLWLACVSLTDQFVHERLTDERYQAAVMELEQHINSSGNNGKITSVTLKDGTKGRAPDCSRISYEEEPRLMLLSEWTLFDSMLCSSYIKKLTLLLARMGFALIECQQKFAYMSHEVRRKMKQEFDRFLPEYGLNDFYYRSFLRLHGYSSRVSAADVVYGITALLESFLGSGGSSVSEQFGEAFDALSLNNLGKLRSGMQQAIKVQRAILRQGSVATTYTECIRSGRKFRWLKVKDSVDAKYLGYPEALTKLCHFLIDASQLCALKFITHILESDSIQYSRFPVSSYFLDIHKYTGPGLCSSSEDHITKMLISWGCHRDLKVVLKLGPGTRVFVMDSHLYNLSDQDVVLHTDSGDERQAELAYDYDVLKLANESLQLHVEREEAGESVVKGILRDDLIYEKKSRWDESDDESDDNEEIDSDNKASSEDEFVSEDDGEEDTERGGYITFPSRSEALAKLPKEYRKILKKNVIEYIEAEHAQPLFSQERFRDVLDTNPIPETYFLTDSNGWLHLYWYVEGPDSKFLIDEDTRKILQLTQGPVRNQEKHRICWTYTSGDTISATRVLHGLDQDFVPLSPMFLCRNAYQQKYLVSRMFPGEHICFGGSLTVGLMYAKLHGIPRERPEDRKFECRDPKEFVAGNEVLYRINNTFHYPTLDLALERLKSGYTVAAGLLCFDGWDKKHKNDGMYIYNGPESGGKYSLSSHSVLMVDFMMLHDKKVAICKSSNGETVGNRGYFAVNLEIMITVVGAAKIKGEGNWCKKKPQYLLSDFHSVDVDIGPQPLIQVDADRVEKNMKFKVDEKDYAFLRAPKYQNRVTESASQRGNAAIMAMTRREHPLLSLNPYQGSWTIKVSTTNKEFLRTYNNNRGEGCVFNVELTDEEGRQVREFVFNASARNFYDRFQMGKFFNISKGSFKLLANKQFKTVQNDCEMTLSEESEIEEARNDNFVPTAELGAYVNQKELTGVVVPRVYSTMGIKRRNDNGMIPKKDITFADETKKTVLVSLWNELATGIGQEQQDTTIKSLKVGDFQGVPLATTSRSNVMINPDSPDATKLEYWYDSEGTETSTSAIGSGTSPSVNNGSRSMYSGVCLSHLTSNLSIGEEKPEFFSSRVYTSSIKPEQTMWYRACKTCNKKVTEAMDSGYWCEGCKKKDDECSLR